MPLASVEEWRARIGSCWCALGRPFKTNRSSENHRPCAVSGGAMLRAMYALMVMVLVLGAKNISCCISECRRQLRSKLYQLKT